MRCLLAHLDADGLIVENYLTGQRTQLDHRLLPVLGRLESPVSRSYALELLGGPVGRPVLAQLVAQGVLAEEGSALDQRDRAFDSAWPWGVDAGYFHCSTGRTRFAFDPARERADLLAKAATVRQPPAFKDYGRADCRLPPLRALPQPLGDALASRRTGRAFADRPIGLPELASVLGWTWGITELRPDPGVGVVALKTSPSGGARHPVEAYCVVQRVMGLEPGVYHYCAGRHVLSRLESRTRLADGVLAAFTQQDWVAEAAAVFVMTGVTARSAWKYPQSHAYRVLLLDAGHLGQTFHLVCTALGLSPWSSAALDEEAAEALLDLTDPGEIVLYGAACGWPRRDL